MRCNPFDTNILARVSVLLYNSKREFKKEKFAAFYFFFLERLEDNRMHGFSPEGERPARGITFAVVFFDAAGRFRKKKRNAWIFPKAPRQYFIVIMFQEGFV